MPRKKTRYPIESFGPELMEALLKGGRERLIITFAGGNSVGFKKAVRFQQRINMLRSRMREENHQQHPLAMRVKVSRAWGDKAVALGAPDIWKDDVDGRDFGCLVVLQPQDQEFAEELSHARSMPVEIDDAPASKEPSSDLHATASVDDLLSELDEHPKGEL
jgi:hypothetical protein